MSELSREKRVVQEVLMEHFGFVPSSFSRRAVDLANEVIYQAMDSIEKVVKAKLGTSDQVEKGLLRLETLLESLVDLRFDQYEAYLHRNVFTIQPALVPYLKLDHHPSSGLPDSLRATDEALLKELDDERRAYEQELDDKHFIDLADERLQVRLEALMALDVELSNLGLVTEQHQEQVVQNLEQLSLALPQLTSVVHQLHALQAPGAVDPNLAKRDAYICKAAQARLSKVAQDRSDALEGGSGSVQSVKQQMQTVGSTGDAQALLGLVSQQK